MNRVPFIVDEEGFTNVYVGGCTLNPGTPTETNGFGVYWGPRHQDNLSRGTRQNRSANNGEIQGAKTALTRAQFNGVEKLRVNTSSQVLYDALTDSIAKWKENNWRNESDGKKIRNCSSWKQLDKAIGKLREQKPVEFNYVSANSGNIHQDYADYLAVNGAERWPN